MTLNQIVRDYRDEICGGIPWVVVYKHGRSWYAKAFWPEDGEYDTGYTFDLEDLQELEEIVNVDPKAICINGYYMGFGYDFKPEEIDAKIRYFYTQRRNLLQGDFLDCMVVK